MNYSNLNNPNWIPSGNLLQNNSDYGNINGVAHDPKHFDGYQDSICNPDIFWKLYNFMFYTAFDTTLSQMPLSPSVLRETVLSTTGDEIILGSMKFPYSILNDAWTEVDANNNVSWKTVDYLSDTVWAYDTTVTPPVRDSIITILNDTVYYDADSLAAVSLVEHEVFAVAAFNDYIVLDSGNDPVTFTFPSVYNFTSTPSLLYLSFDGGQNYTHSIFQGVNNSLTVSNHGFVHGLNEIRVSTTNNNEPPLAIFTLDVIIRKNHADYQIDTFPSVSCPSLDFSEGDGQGIATIKLSQNNNVLTKPVLIVEGLDIYRPLNALFDRPRENGGVSSYGVYGWDQFAQGVVDIDGSPNPYRFGDVLLEELDSLGYDIVFLDLSTSRIEVQRNANLLIKVIEYLKNELDSNESNEEIAVMGLGTGGVIARVALRKMELQDCCHRTRMFTSFDSPHKGLNIPISIQAFLNDANDHFNSVPNSSQIYNLFSPYLDYVLNLLEMEPYFRRTNELRRFDSYIIKSPLFQQLIIQNIDGDVRQNTYLVFQNYLDSIGMPKSTRNFAVTNGSEVGVLQTKGANDLNFMQTNSPFFEYLKTSGAAKNINITAKNAYTYSKDISQGTNWIRARAQPLVVGDFNQQSQNEIYKRGKSINYNMIHLFLHQSTALAGILAAQQTQIIAAYLTAQFAITNPPAILPTLSWAGLTSLSIYTTTNMALDNSLALNASNNNLNDTSLNIKNPYPTLAYDPAPGGFTDYYKDFKKMGDSKYFTFTNERHSLVPTISALNIDSDVLDMDIDFNKNNLIQSGTLPFEDYHAPRTLEGAPRPNELHGLLTIDDQIENKSGNIHWFIEKLEFTKSKVVASPQQFVVLNSETMNYGVPDNLPVAPEKFLLNTEVNANAKLAINTNESVGRGIHIFNAPQVGSSFSTTTLNPTCGSSIVIVDSLGLFQLGSYNPSENIGTNAEVTFLEGSVLELLSGSTLEVYADSRLIIDEGATLVVHPDVDIKLNNDNSIFEIRGNVELKDGATFGLFQGDGFILINQEIHNQQQFNQKWNIGDSTTFKVYHDTTNQNFNFRNKTALRLQSPLYLPSTMDVNLVNTKILFQSQHASININGNHYINHVIAENDTLLTNKSNDGIRIFSSGARVKNSDFIGFKTGLTFALMQGQHGSVFDCKFSRNRTGAYVFDRGVFFNRCDFEYNKNGLFIDYLGTNMLVRDCNVSNNELGLGYISNENVNLTLRRNDIVNNTTNGVWGEGGMVFLDCNNISNNSSYGVDANASEIIATNNLINGNDVGIRLMSSNRFQIDDGNNTFGNNQQECMEVYLTSQAIPYLQIMPDGSMRLPVSNNEIPLSSPGQVCAEIFLDGDPIGLYNWTPGYGIAYCRNIHVHSGHNTILDSLFGGRVELQDAYDISLYESVNFQGVTITNMGELFDALHDALLPYEHTGNELIAIELINGVLVQLNDTYEYATTTGLVRLALDYAYYLMTHSLSMAYTSEQLEPAAADPTSNPNFWLTAVVDEASRRLTSYEDHLEDDYMAIFNWNLRIGHLYRTGQHHQLAQQAWVDHINWAEGREAEIVAYWQCVLDAEIP
ncbi:MAG: right-handed parallel beta-helix repeat-containing protein, partial [Schleiferiaceae bacterium]|nr:right-handed parallel beta-helix repeat-containing protein [Schleiferiaceae bacterium]